MGTITFPPQELIKYYESLVKGVSTVDFFSKPHHSKAQEVWCAAHFAQGFNQHINACSVILDEADAQTDADFGLIVKGLKFPFQITEVQDPKRRRGDEYKNSSMVDIESEDYALGSENDSSWIRGAIEKKINKSYSDSQKLNLLVYVDFPAWEYNYKKIIDKTNDLYNVFASIWLINGVAICALHTNVNLGSIDGWKGFN